MSDVNLIPSIPDQTPQQNNTIREIENGYASNFRGNINYNFDYLKKFLNNFVVNYNKEIPELDTICDELTGRSTNIVCQRQQPSSSAQKPGDYWFKEI